MYGLHVHHLRYDAAGVGHFDADGHLGDVSADGTILTFGSREQMEALAADLAERHAGGWSAVPLPMVAAAAKK
jgi:hypothetical protein